MKFSGRATDMAKAVALAASVAPQKHDKPIITNLALIAHDDYVEIMATDLKTGVRLKVTDVTINKTGSVVINAKKAAQVFNKIGKDKVTVSLLKSGCQIATKGYKSKLQTFNIREFPKLVEFDDDADGFSIPVSTLKSMIKKTSFAVAKIANNYAMHGIFIELMDDNLRFVATDTKRLAYRQVPLEGNNEDDAVIVPKDSMGVVFKSLLDGEEDVDVRINDATICMKSDKAVISMQQLHGQFPPYHSFVDVDFGTPVIFDRKQFIDALDKASLFTSPNSQIVVLDFMGDGLSITAQSTEFGESDVFIEPEEVLYEPMKMGLNPEILMDALKVMKSETFTMYVSEPVKPVLLQEPDDTYKCIVIPVLLH